VSRIRLLPDDLINQIAAGEVIERPASVVKELIENALDAGSRSLAIDVEAGGRRRVRVADDGEGLERDDVLMALERHATSKLSTARDLSEIRTLGFRGEALPAIASVSRLTIASSTDGRTGSRLEVEGGRLGRLTPAGHPRGTTVDVQDLFFNTPARAKFLKSPQTELSHISDLVAACAVAHPTVGFSLAHEGRILLQAPAAADERARISQVFGADWDDAIPLHAVQDHLEARGLIAPPDGSASTRRMQHLYVNGRLVRDRLVGHAILSACQAFLPKDRYAAIFLFLTCPPSRVDVNVHPAKAEVRFTDPRAVHALVQRAILDALRDRMPLTAFMGAGAPGFAPDMLPPAFGAARGEAAAGILHEPAAAGYVGFGGFGAGEGSPIRLPGTAAGAVALAHFRESYIVAADDLGLLLIDQHAAHERILYERLLRQTSTQGGERQRLLFSITLDVPRALAADGPRLLEDLDRMGVTAEEFGDRTLKVTEAPGLLDAGALPALLSDLMQQMLEEETAPAGASAAAGPAARHDRMLATVACHAAIKVRMPLTLEKMNYLIKELFQTRSPMKCPHGRPAVLRFSDGAIEKGFDRAPRKGSVSLTDPA